MTELEKLVQTWEKHKPTGTPHEHIWNGFIDDAKAAIEREKQALSIANVSHRRELLKAFLDWQQNKYPMPYDTDIKEQLNAFEAFNCG